MVDKNEQVLAKALEIAHEIATQTSVVSNAMNKALLWHPKPTPQQQESLEAVTLYHLGASGEFSFYYVSNENFCSLLHLSCLNPTLY